MESVLKNILDKVSSYDLFTNFFPGLVFCCLLEQNTRFEIVSNSTWERIVLFYFVGMVLSRIGSIGIETLLLKLEVKNKKTNEKEPFLKYAPYEDYVEASNSQPIIGILLEINNMYRTMIAVFLLLILAKIYDCLLYDLIHETLHISGGMIFIVICILLLILFSFSCRKQTSYIRRRVEKYIKEKN